MSTRLSPSARLTITTVARELYATMSLEAVVDELRQRGIRTSPNTVGKLLVAAGVAMRPHGGRRVKAGGRPEGRANPLDDEDRALILSVAREIYPAQTIPAVVQEVAQRGLRVSPATVRIVLIAAGVEMAPRGPRRTPASERPVSPGPTSPSVVAWEAMCGPHRTRLAASRHNLTAMARRLSNRRELDPQQRAGLDKVRQELSDERAAIAACPNCRGGAGS